MTQKNKFFIPPYPQPHANKIDRFKRFFIGLSSWIHTLYEKSYVMKLGEVHLPRLRMFIANEKDLAHRILMDREGKFPKHKVQHDMLCPLLGESVFSTNGEKWRNQRQMINPSFAHTNLKAVFVMMCHASQEMVNNLTHITMRQEGYIHIDPIMTHITADIIFRTILSQKLTSEDAHKIHNAFNRYQTFAQRITNIKLFGLPVFGFERKMKTYATHIHQVFENITKKRYEDFHDKVKKNQDLPNNDILDSLMAAKNPETGQSFSFKDIIDQLSIIFLAGHETSASALTWSLYLLGQCSHLQEKAYQEVSRFEEVTFENIKELTIIESIFNEAMRLYPPVSFLPREANENMEIRGKNIQKGDMLTVSPWLLHRNKNYWDNPHAFNPERFQNDDKQTKEIIRSCFIPFGKGPRICVGAGFAKQEAVIILKDIIKNFKIEVDKNHKVEPVSRMTTRPKNGVYLKFLPR